MSNESGSFYGVGRVMKRFLVTVRNRFRHSFRHSLALPSLGHFSSPGGRRNCTSVVTEAFFSAALTGS
jgi:hypothetical protein